MTTLVCTATGKHSSASEARWRSEAGALLDLDFTPQFPLDRIAVRKPTLWRYREALPLEDDRNIVSFEEGFTPLLSVHILGREVFIKQDHLFPTGSYKDRGATMLISKAHELGVQNVVQDSSGNAGCAVAAYAARAGIVCDIYVPEGTSPAKLAQIRQYGARLHLVRGTREDTARAALVAAENAYYASHCWNPFFLHGTKTFAYEVCEQLGWRSPDRVVLPVGNGTLVLGASIGFRELREAGICGGIPRIIAVQSAACAPLVQAFHGGAKGETFPGRGHTIAEGIAIANPVRGAQILEAIRLSGGDLLAVTEEELRAALALVSRMGFYIEPTAAAAVAGLQKIIPHAEEGETLVSVFTGHGLKSPEKMT